MNANTAESFRNFLTTAIPTYSNRLLLDSYNDGEAREADMYLAEINSRGGIAAVEAAKYAPIAKPHTDACTALDGEDCCANYAYGTNHLYIDL